MNAVSGKAADRRLGLVAAASLSVLALAQWAAPAHAQVVGSYDNFDVFNDDSQGRTAEGFEIDIEDVKPADLTREFPSNFTQPWLIRYGLPTLKSYDWTAVGSKPDAAHAYDAGHKGVLVTYAAKPDGKGGWIASQGDTSTGAPGAAGNGTPFNPSPTATMGESCWWWGLGAAYPASGCEHLGVSFAGGVTPGRITYHWKYPNLANTGLVNGKVEASIPPAPVLAPVPVAPGALPVVHAKAGGPVDVGGNPEVMQAAEPVFGPGYWVKVTTIYARNRAALNQLQVHVVKFAPVVKVVNWTLLQKPPGVGPNKDTPERADDVNDPFSDTGLVAITKQYQYFKFKGATDSETRQALCETFYATAAAAAARKPAVQIGCQNAGGNDYPYLATYYTIDPVKGIVRSPGGNLGVYLGAHVAAYNVK